MNRHVRMFPTAALLAIFAISLQLAAMAQPPLIANSAVKADKVGQTVAVQGKITNITTPSSERAPYAIFINDDTEVLRIVIFQDMFKSIANPEQFAIGKRVKAVGEVKEYRGNVEVHLKSAASLELYDGPAAAAVAAPGMAKVAAPAAPSAPAAPAINVPAPADLVAISTINAAAKDKTVSIRGKVTGVRPSSRENVPTTVSVQDDTGTIDVVFWEDIGSLIPAASKPTVGAHMQFSGKVNVYRDKPQVKLGKASDIVRLGAAAGASAAPATAAAPAVAAPAANLSGIDFTPSANIEKSMVGKPVAVKGKVTRVINVNGGKLVEVTDDSGKIMVPCWENTVGSSPYFAALKEGAAIAVKGEVDFYEQRQQIQVKLIDAAGLLSVQ